MPTRGEIKGGPIKYDLSKFDFLDLGSKTGGSINYCAKRFRTGPNNSATGIGIDFDPDHVQASRQAGFAVLEQDILDLDVDHKFRFVSALDFLEHLPDLEAVKAIVQKMSQLASDFLFIRHPSFEDVEYLKALGLKITWTDWSMHTAPIKLHDFASIFNQLGLRQYCFNHRGEIIDSSDERIVPLSAPVDTHAYSSDHGKKPLVKFDKKIFSQIDIFVPLRPLAPKEWNWITREA